MLCSTVCCGPPLCVGCVQAADDHAQRQRLLLAIESRLTAHTLQSERRSRKSCELLSAEARRGTVAATTATLREEQKTEDQEFLQRPPLLPRHHAQQHDPRRQHERHSVLLAREQVDVVGSAREIAVRRTLAYCRHSVLRPSGDVLRGAALVDLCGMDGEVITAPTVVIQSIAYLRGRCGRMSDCGSIFSAAGDPGITQRLKDAFNAGAQSPLQTIAQDSDPVCEASVRRSSLGRAAPRFDASQSTIRVQRKRRSVAQVAWFLRSFFAGLAEPLLPVAACSWCSAIFFSFRLLFGVRRNDRSVVRCTPLSSSARRLRCCQAMQDLVKLSKQSRRCAHATPGHGDLNGHVFQVCTGIALSQTEWWAVVGM